MVHASEQVHDMLDAVLRMNVRRPGIISSERNFSFHTSDDSKIIGDDLPDEVWREIKDDRERRCTDSQGD